VPPRRLGRGYLPAHARGVNLNVQLGDELVEIGGVTSGRRGLVMQQLRGRAISGPLTPVTRGVSRSLTDSPRCRSGRMAARIAQIPKLIAPLGKIGLAAEGMQVELWLASPEPAVGVFTPAGTCTGRLRRHCVIGCADLDRTRLPSGSAAVGFGGGVWAGPRAVSWPPESPTAVMRPGRKGSGHRCAISVPLATVSSGKLRCPTVSQIGRSCGKTGLY
jgi:hypothetical protein